MRYGIVQMAIGSVLASFSPVLVSLSHTGPAVDGFYRMFIGGISLLLVALYSRQSFHCSGRLSSILFVAAASISLDLLLWHYSIGFIGPGLATVIINCQVFFMIVIGVVAYGEKPNWKIIIALPLGVLGIFLLVGLGWQGGSAHYRLGIGLCFIAAAAYTLFLLLLRHSQSIKDALHPVVNLAIINLFSALFFFLVIMVQSEPLIPVHHADFAVLILYGLMGQAIAWLFIARGLPLVSVALAGFLLLIQPILAFVWDVVFFHRQTGLWDYTGLVLTLFSIYLASICYSKAEN
ncbi:MAG: DMT family transporter [Gammaproteobacteria bacterium]